MKAWRLQPPRNRLREDAGTDPGPRRNIAGLPVAEQIIEMCLFGQKLRAENRRLSIQRDEASHQVRALYNHLPLTNTRKGQRYPDVFGVIETQGGQLHTLAIEAKEMANDCWYAVVENLVQIRLLRANPDYQKSLLERVGVHTAKRIVGTWGLVLAPEKYYTGSQKRQADYGQALGLIRILSGKTEARIILGVWDSQNEVIRYKGGYWPR